MSQGEDQRLNFNGTLTLQLLAIMVLWALAVMNTELLIVWNRFDSESSNSPQSMWQFGQVRSLAHHYRLEVLINNKILPLLLIVVPFLGMIKTFKAHGLQKFLKEGNETKKEVCQCNCKG